MALSNGPNLGLLVNGDAGEEHYDELMAQWRGFDVLIQCSVLDRDLSAPPGSPTNGAAYIVAAGASGAWSGNANNIARWSSVTSAWEFFVPKAGWRAHVVDEAVTLTFVAGSWQQREAPLLTAVEDIAATAYTFVLADSRGRKVRSTSASATVFTVPPDVFPVGAVIPVRRTGAGTLGISPGAGVTINTPTGLSASAARQGSEMLLHCVANNVFDITGDLANV